MLCPVCGSYADDDAIVCGTCGKLLERKMQDVEEEELMQRRQGRHLRQPQPPQEEAPHPRTGGSRSFEDPQPPVTPESTGAAYTQREVLSSTGRYYGLEMENTAEEDDNPRRYMPPATMQEYSRRSRVKRHLSYKRMVNWAYVIIAVLVLLLAAVVGTFLYMTRTDNGQAIMARMGYRDVSPTALWRVGDEYFEKGELDLAIECYLAAREMNEEAKEPNPAGLLQLGAVYVAKGDFAAAEEVYTYVYTEVVPTAAEAYSDHVDVLLEQGRDAEAAELLQKAYEMTGVASFRSERAEILPSIPTVSVAGGYYTSKKSVSILQAEEYDIVYTLDPFAVLPENGIAYTEPVELGEGEHELRAVAVNGDLVSDELEVNYQIYMPTPLAPGCNIAPGEYQSARKNVRLWPGTLTDEELAKNPGYAATLKDEVAQTITIYYTIDGSMPDADSPIYTGEPIVMNTNGYNYLRAVSVNGYGKQGNIKTVQIKLSLKTKAQKVYCMEDTIGTLKLASTTREAFLSQFGAGEGMETVWLSGFDGECERYTYPWGYATFVKLKTGWQLAEIYLTSNELKAPRGTGIGSTEEEIVSKYKDFNQVESPSGNRGLYEDGNDKGKIYVQEEGGKIVRYRAATEDAHIWQLDYVLDASGKCTAIHWLYER